MKINEKKSSRSKLIILSAVIILIVAVTALSGFLAARFFMDDGHDVVASHDTFDVRIVAKNSETGDLYNVENGIITIENGEGFKSNTPLPISVDVYYKGESYAYVRLMIMENWSGTYAETMGGPVNQSGILPEPLMTLNLNEDVPMADNRLQDGYVYLTQIQTTLTEAEADTNLKNQNEILNTKSSDETMYTYQDGNFVQSENGEYKKLTIIKDGDAFTPQFSDELDSVNSATATVLKLYLEADAVQFNRFKTFWNITEIPQQTNIPDEITE